MAGVKSGSDITADNLSITASRESKIGQNTSVNVTTDALIESTGGYTGSHATINSGANVTVGGDMSLMSGNKATIGQNTVVIVVPGKLTMDASSTSKCVVKATAAVAYGTKSGNCSNKLP